MFPRSEEQTQSILQHQAAAGARSAPSDTLNLAGKKDYNTKNKESDIAHNINITTMGHIRYGISATQNNSFPKPNLSNVSYSEMRK